MKITSSVDVWNTVKLWLLSSLELLLFLPVWILFQVYVLPYQVESMWMAALPLLSLGGILLGYRFNVKWKQLIASIILGGILGICSGNLTMNALPLGVAGFICTFLGITVVTRGNRINMHLTGIVFYLVATIVFQRFTELESSVTLLTWCGSFCLLITLFIFNNDFLQISSLSQDRKALPKGIGRNNRIYVIVIGIIAALLAAGVGKAIGLFIWRILRSMIGMLVKLFSGSSEPLTEPDALPPSSPELPFVNDQEPGLLAAIMDIMVYVVGAAIIGAVAYYGLRWLYRNAGGRIRKVIDAILSMLFREQATKAKPSYMDEEKSIFTWEQSVQGFKEFWSNRLTPRSRKDRYEHMKDEGERARWLYRHWLHLKRVNGYEFKRYLTPKETAQDVMHWEAANKHPRKKDSGSVSTSNSLVELYEQARYGEDQPSAPDVAATKNQLKL